MNPLFREQTNEWLHLNIVDQIINLTNIVLPFNPNSYLLSNWDKRFYIYIVSIQIPYQVFHT